jgi:hypothetical protein
MILPKCLAWVNGVFSSVLNWTKFVNWDLLSVDVKKLISGLEAIYNDQANLKDENPFKYLVKHGQRQLDEVVVETLLCFLLNDDDVREALLTYLCAKQEWMKFLETSQKMEVTKQTKESNVLQEKVDKAHTRLDQVVAEALQFPLIQDCLSTVQEIVNDADKAQDASLRLYDEQLTKAMEPHYVIRDDLVQRLTMHLQAIDAKITADNLVQP